MMTTVPFAGSLQLSEPFVGGSIRVNVLHGGRAGDTLAIKIFFTLSHNKIIAEKV